MTVTKPILISETASPHLDFQTNVALWTAITLSDMDAAEVTVAFTYAKQTDTKPRIAGEDYVAMPGVAPNAFFGKITSVRRRNKDDAVRFNIASLSRGDGESPSKPTTLIPQGVLSFTVTGFVDLSKRQGQ